MFARRFCFVALLGLAAVPAAHAADTTPTLVVRVRSIDGLLGDVKHLADLAGREANAKAFDAQIKKMLPKGFAGIDTKRPLGFYGIVDPDGNLKDISGALLVPVADEKAFLGLLESLKLKAQKEDDGTY